MATLETERFCPNHGEYVLLADCPIVATSELVNGQARLAASPEFNFGEGASNDAGNVFGDGEVESRRVPAALAPETGSLMQSKIDDVTRKVLAPQAGRPRRRGAARAELPSAAALAPQDAAARPARACPHCCHPLPEGIDERDPYIVALAGHTGASKTTTVLALMKTLDALGPDALGVRGFSATAATMEYLRTLGPEALADFSVVGGTDRGRHPPFEFLTTLPATRIQGEKDAVLLLQDAAGEDLMGNDSRVYYAPSVAWSDAVLFVYNPEDAPWWPSRLPDRPRQAALLDGIRDDLETRKRARGETRFPPLVIAVSKADLLQPRPEFDGDEAGVQAVVEKLGDKSMITAAERWEDVAWRFIAPAPADASPQKGVTELFRLLLSLLRD